MMTDLYEIKKHYDAFWANSHIDRCCLNITVPCTNPPEPKSLTQQWEDIPFRCSQAAYIAENTKYFADAFANVFINFGPGCMAEFVGGSFKWAPDTVWFDQEQYITDFENLPEIKLNKESFLFRLADSFTNEVIKSVNAIPSVPDIGGLTDIIASLRGSQDLLFDLYDYPDEVMELNKVLQPMWLETFNYFSQLVLKNKGLMTAWMPILSDKPYYPLQCDFSAMISPDMFQKFVVPELEFQSSHIPRSVYHLDGENATVHLESLLNIKEINAIQWSPGAGNPNVDDKQWFDMYRRIQAAGKGIILLESPADGVENILKNISPDGLFISTICEDEKQADEIIKCAIKK